MKQSLDAKYTVDVKLLVENDDAVDWSRVKKCRALNPRIALKSRETLPP